MRSLLCLHGGGVTLAQHRTRLRRLATHRDRLPAAIVAAAQAAHTSAVPMRVIAEALGVSVPYAHRLVHGRSDR